MPTTSGKSFSSRNTFAPRTGRRSASRAANPKSSIAKWKNVERPQQIRVPPAKPRKATRTSPQMGLEGTTSAASSTSACTRGLTRKVPLLADSKLTIGEIEIFRQLLSMQVKCGHVQLRSLNEVQNRGCFGFQHAFHEQLALSILHGNGDGGGMHVHADILLLIHKGAPFR